MLGYLVVLSVLLVAWLLCCIVAANSYGSKDKFTATLWAVLSVAVGVILIWYAIAEGDYDKDVQKCTSAGYSWINERGCYDLRHIPPINLDQVLTPNENHVK